jgi:hypothetical protein
MSEKTKSTSKEKENSEKLINFTRIKKSQKVDDYIFNTSTNDLLNENIKISPMINPIPCFTVKNENLTKDEIASQNTFYTNLNLNKNMSINISYNMNEEEISKKDKTKILNKNIKRSINNKINNNRFFRQFSPNLELSINTSNKNRNVIYDKIKNEIFLSNKKKQISNIARKKLPNQKNIFNNIKKHKLINQLYFSTDNFYDSNLLDEKIEEKKEEKKRQIKSLGQKINVATMKIEILQNYKKNKNINTIKKKIEYNKIYCNNDLKRLQDNYNMNINKLVNQIKFLEIKLIKYQECYITIIKHKEEIKKEELKHKIKKMEYIDKIFSLKKILNELLISNKNDINNETHNFDDSFEDKTINDMSFNDYNNLKDTIILGNGVEKNIKVNNNNFVFESKIIKMNKHQINFFKAKFIDKVHKK